MFSLFHERNFVKLFVVDFPGKLILLDTDVASSIPIFTYNANKIPQNHTNARSNTMNRSINRTFNEIIKSFQSN
jgi:hypothetical protein